MDHPNTLVSCWLIDQLVQQGVHHFCIAPGSRSTPLALAVANHPHARYTVHFDERGLSFFALGMALGSHHPTAIIVTSGSAVGNLLPAIMEAFHSSIPLILLTADRPPEARACGANQTIDQVKIFHSRVHWQFDFPPPSVETDETFIRSQVAQACFCSRKGPVQLNCMFRKPLWEHPIDPYPIGKPIEYLLPKEEFSKEASELWGRRLSKKKGIILIGRMESFEEIPSIFALAKRLGWPICADILSQARCEEAPKELIRHTAQITPPAPPDYVLHFGEAFVLPHTEEWGPRIHISSKEALLGHKQIARIKISAQKFCEALSCEGCDSTWLHEWKCKDQQISSLLEPIFDEGYFHTESSAMRLLSKEMPPEWLFFLGASMPIREADLFLHPDRAKGFFSNRGVSGIDGTLATAIGIAEGRKSPLIAILGDQASLHDLNSFALLRTMNTPFILIIFNNFGGGIFSHLPIFGKTTHFEELFSAVHPWNFESIANMFDIPYERTEIGWKESLTRALSRKGPSILEWPTSREESRIFHKETTPPIS